ncbi:hypothetical protein [uncultured Clostridium sp.]|jgi:hypothetical protein|uniref:hypothetical protein n=1 Tax=uncultured Clostridium sp. TaxID=59620 RepID=UPI0026104B3A|nr:hypothetical protein [uncultured Clostridium sp.]
MMERVDSRLQEQLQIIGNKSQGARALSETSILTHSFLFTDSIQDPELKRLVRDILDAVERGEKNLVQYYKKIIDYLRTNISDVGAIALAITAILWILFKFRFKEELSPA